MARILGVSCTCCGSVHCAQNELHVSVFPRFELLVAACDAQAKIQSAYVINGLFKNELRRDLHTDINSIGSCPRNTTKGIAEVTNISDGNCFHEELKYMRRRH